MDSKMLATLSAFGVPTKKFLADYAAMSPSKVWYVKQGGTGNGTPDSPFGTIQAAVNAASAGDTIMVAAGTYNENLTVDGLRITKSLNLIGAGMATRIINTNVAATSIVHLVGETGTDKPGCLITKVWCDGTTTVPECIVIDKDYTYLRITECVLTDTVNYVINYLAKRTYPIIFINNNIFSGGLWCIQILPDTSGAGWVGDDVGIFVEDNMFIIVGDFAGNGGAIYVQGDAVHSTAMMMVIVKGNKIYNGSGEAMVKFGNLASLSSCVDNVFGTYIQGLGVKDLNLGFGGVPPVFPNTVKNNIGLQERDAYYPELSLGVTIVAAAVAFTFGAWVEIVPPAAMTRHFKLQTIAFDTPTGVGTVMYVIQVGIGGVGAETPICTWKGVLGVQAASLNNFLDLDAESLPPNSRIAMRLASSTGVADSVGVSLGYKTVE